MNHKEIKELRLQLKLLTESRDFWKAKYHESQQDLRSIIEAYNEPHYGDKDAQLDHIYEAVEKYENKLKER